MRILLALILVTSCFVWTRVVAQSPAVDEMSSYATFINDGKQAYMQGDTGRARLYWERALLIDARGPEALQNIAFLKRNMPEEVIAVPAFFVSRWWSGFSSILRPGSWMIIQLIGFGLLMILLYRLWVQNKPINGLLVKSTALVGMIILAYLAGKTATNKLQTDKYAIAMQSCSMYEGADVRSPKVSAVEPGHKTVILDALGEWYKISRADKVQGWVQMQCLERI